MFLLAAKLALVLTLDGFQAARMPSREVALWNQIRPAIVTLYDNGRKLGVAALLDDKGYFVAQSSSTSGSRMVAVTSSGRQISLTTVSRERASMLVLLKADSWEQGIAKPFHPPVSGEDATGELIAVLPSGPFRMTYGGHNKLGVLKSSRRIVPLTEVRFEAAQQLVGGALIFSETGEIVGSLNATLGRVEDNSQQRNFNGGGVGGRPTDNLGQQLPSKQQVDLQSRQYTSPGPSEMTVAYTVNAEFVRHVLDGFLSPSHEVDFAILGVFCTDAIGGGALIQQVTPESPAAKVGLQGGDVIVNINSSPVQDQLAFASVMLQQKVGKRIPVLVQRGSRKFLVDVIPGKALE